MPGLVTAPTFLEEFMGDRVRKRCVNDAVDFGQDVDNSMNDVPLYNSFNNGLAAGMSGYERQYLGLEGNPEALGMRPGVQQSQAIARYPGSQAEQAEGAYPGGVGFANSQQAIRGDILGKEQPHVGGNIPSITQGERPGLTGLIPSKEQAMAMGATPLPRGVGMERLGDPSEEEKELSLRRRGLARR